MKYKEVTDLSGPKSMSSAVYPKIGDIIATFFDDGRYCDGPWVIVKIGDTKKTPIRTIYFHRLREADLKANGLKGQINSFQLERFTRIGYHKPIGILYGK